MFAKAVSVFPMPALLLACDQPLQDNSQGAALPLEPFTMQSAIAGPVVVLSSPQSSDEPTIQGVGPYQQQGGLLVGLLVDSAIVCGAPLTWTMTGTDGLEATIFPSENSRFYRTKDRSVPRDFHVVACVKKRIAAQFKAGIASNAEDFPVADSAPFKSLYAQAH